jgi:hypothetical protein
MLSIYLLTTLHTSRLHVKFQFLLPLPSKKKTTEGKVYVFVLRMINISTKLIVHCHFKK